MLCGRVYQGKFFYKKPNLCPHDSYSLMDNLQCTRRWEKLITLEIKNLLFFYNIYFFSEDKSYVCFLQILWEIIACNGSDQKYILTFKYISFQIYLSYAYKIFLENKIRIIPRICDKLILLIWQYVINIFHVIKLK